MNGKSLLEDFKNKSWNYMFVEGSPLGNTSFLLLFLKNIILGEKTADGGLIDRLLDDQIQVMYLRTEDIPNNDKISKSVIKDIESLSLIETIFNEDAFEYRNILRTLQNRKYTHLIIDDVRKKYEDNRMEKFMEVLHYCKQSKIKLIVSATDIPHQKLDYLYYDADLIFNVTPYIMQNVYSIEIEDKKSASYKKYALTMR